MALIQSKALARWRMIFFLSGLLALYLAERSLSGHARTSVLAYAGLALVVGCTLFVVSFVKELRTSKIYRSLSLDYLFVLLSVGLFFLCNEVLERGPLQNTLQVIWPALGLFGLLPLCAKEWSLVQMLSAPFVDEAKLFRIGQGARIVVLGIITFAAVNVMATRWHRNVDLSYFKTTKVGEGTRSLAAGVTKELTIYAFYPAANEVELHLREYFTNLGKVSPRFAYKRVDQSVAQNLARRFKIRSNGTLVLAQGAKFETLEVGLKMMSSRRTLTQLDARVHMHLLKLLKAPRVVYFTTGHLERDFAPGSSDARLGYRDLKKLLETKNVESKRLGLGDGLGQGVPDDAALVIVAGPREEFMPAEKKALKEYMQSGGRMLILFDPDTSKPVEFLLQDFGLSTLQSRVASERFSVRVIGRDKSPYNMATTRFNAHPSVYSLSRGAGRLGLVLLGAGALELVKDKKQGDNQIKFPVKAMSDSWLDRNGNGVFDLNVEKRSNYNLVAAVENPKRKMEKESKEFMRALVVADADVAGDGLMRNPGNAYFMMDAFNWLIAEENELGAIESEEDVALVHRRDEDVVWFYGTSILIPAAILFAGVFITRKRQRKRNHG